MVKAFSSLFPFYLSHSSSLFSVEVQLLSEISIGWSTMVPYEHTIGSSLSGIYVVVKNRESRLDSPRPSTLDLR